MNKGRQTASASQAIWFWGVFFAADFGSATDWNCEFHELVETLYLCGKQRAFNRFRWLSSVWHPQARVITSALVWPISSHELRNFSAFRTVLVV